ncbi:MAG: cyclase family protein [bacterium]|nr:cyclase family protein [bacterium]
MFDIDLTRYRILDLSKEVIPPGTEDRPFKVQKSFLSDRTYKHDVWTHSHVGTHIEASSHFYDDGKDINEYPLEAFFGRAILLDAEPGVIDVKVIENLIGDIIKEQDIVICRNKRVESGYPYLTAESARWLAERNIKMLGIDTNFKLGRDVEEGRLIHDILMSKGTTLIEFLDNLHLISKREFFFIALPYKVKMDSSWTRAIAIEER